MVQIQVPPVERVSAVLAGVLVALEDVVAGELDLLLRQPVKYDQQNDPGNTDTERNRADAFRMRGLLGEVMPFSEVERLEIPVTRAQHDLRVPFEQQSEGASSRADIDRLP